MDITLKDIPDSCVERIKDMAMRVAEDTRKAEIKKMTAEEKETFETKTDARLVANGLAKKFDVEVVEVVEPKV